MSERPMPTNGIAWIRGNLVCRNNRDSYDIWGEGTGWWAFGLDRARALRLAEVYPAPGYVTEVPAADQRQGEQTKGVAT